MFCPICKSEYVDNITECSECKVALVESLEDEFEGLAPDFVEESDDSSHDSLADEAKKPSGLYVKKKDKYTDLRFSGFSFIIFSVLGIIFVILNFLGIITFLTTYSTVVMAVIFIIFAGFGISSLKSASKIKDLVEKENDETQLLNEWIEKNFTYDYIDNLYKEDLSQEENYIYLQEQLIDELLNNFPDFEKSYAEQILDELLDKYYQEKQDNYDN